MYSNLVNQLKEQNALDKLEDVMNEIPVVRKAIGYSRLVRRSRLGLSAPALSREALRLRPDPGPR